MINRTYNKLYIPFLGLIAILIVGTMVAREFGNSEYMTPEESEASSTLASSTHKNILLDGVKIKASHSSLDTSYLVDGNIETSWNAGAFAPAWIQLDFGSPITISKIRLLVEQFPQGITSHVVQGGLDENKLVDLYRINEITQNNSWLDVELEQSVSKIRYLRISTDASPSWVAWREIQVFSQTPNIIEQTESTLQIKPVPLNEDLLLKDCVKMGNTPTVQNGQGVPYKATSECMDPKDFVWELGLQSESGYGSYGNCLGFPAVNSIDSPITFDFLDRGNGTYVADMGVDFNEKSHPCGENYFTWYMLMHQSSEYMYPLPTKLISSHKIFFDKNQLSGASRLIAAMSGFTKTGKEPEPEAFTIEIALNLDKEWGDNYPGNPFISYCSIEECGSNHIFMDGSYFGISVTEGVEDTVVIPWHTIYDFLLKSNILPEPYLNNGAYLDTGGVSLGYEVNNFEESSSYKVRLLQSEFKIMSTDENY